MTQCNSKTRVLAAIILLWSAAIAWAQVIVTGLVVDEQHEPIIGASVILKGTKVGTATDINGGFTLNVPSLSSELIISYVGCNTTTVKANSPTLKTGIILTTNAEILNDIIVIGYGSVKKSDATGAVIAIKPDNLNRGAAITPQDALIGRIPGVNVVTQGGAPGSNATMRIRTGSSLSASNSPLIVLDGVPLTDADINDINPMDIASFNILKDASATAIYGSRASNGVIVITTKRGTDGVHIDYSGNLTVSHTAKRIDVLSADEYRDIVYSINGVPKDAVLGDANTDWQDEIYRTAIGTDHNISVNGKVSKLHTPYRVSLGYTNQEGIIKTNRYQRYTGAISLTPELLDKHLNLNLNANISHSRDNSIENGVVGNALIFDATRSPKTGSPTASTDPGLGYFIWTNGGAPMAIQTDNPLAQLELDDRLSKLTRSLGSAQIGYKIHGFEDLKVNLNLGYDYYHKCYDRSVPDLAGMMYTGNQKDGRGLKENKVTDRRDYTLEFFLNYGHNWGKHDLNAMAGYSWQHSWNKSNGINQDHKGNDFSTPTHSESEHYLLSWYGRLNYSFDNRFLLTATFRADASSRFAKENRWGYFPSVAIAWRVINEAFMAEQDIISDLKLRASYGQTGQQNIDNDYPWMTTYTVSYPESMYQFGDEWYQTYRPNGYDRDIKWETTTTWNYGIDYGFLNNRIFGSIDYYRRHTKDLLNNITVPSGVNYSPVIFTNIGSMNNEGIEIAANFVPVSTRDWEWTIGVNYTWQKSKITKLNVVDSKESFVETGNLNSRKYSQVFMVGETPYTYYLAKQAYDENGKPLEGKYIQPDGSIGTTETRFVNKHGALPSSLLGFNTQVHYKNWELNVAAHGMFGNYVYNYVKANQHLSSAYSDQGYFNNLMRSTVETGFDTEQFASDLWLEDGSFFRIDNITLGYTFPRLWNSTSRLRLTAAVNNVCTFTHYSGLDPEIYSGIDKNIYPRPRTFSVGVNLNF